MYFLFQIQTSLDFCCITLVIGKGLVSVLGPVGFEHIFCMIVKIACDIVSTNY